MVERDTCLRDDNSTKFTFHRLGEKEKGRKVGTLEIGHREDVSKLDRFQEKRPFNVARKHIILERTEIGAGDNGWVRWVHFRNCIVNPFTSREGRGKVLVPQNQSVGRVVKEWKEKCGIPSVVIVGPKQIGLLDNLVFEQITRFVGHDM